MSKRTPRDQQRLMPEGFKGNKCEVVNSKGRPCELAAGFGTTHLGSGPCKFHGGSLETVTLKHATVLLEARAQREGIGSIREIEPGQALMEEVWRAAGRVAWIETKLLDLAEEEMFVETVVGKLPSHWLKYELTERARLVDASKTALAAGIAERHVQLAEQQGRLVEQAFRALLADPDLQLTAAQRAAAPSAVRRALTAATTVDVG